MGHQTSDTYGVTLTNQADPTQPGAAGNVVFAIYNTGRDPSYVVDKDTCVRAMQAPLPAYLNQGHKNGKGVNATVARTRIMRAGIILLMELVLLVARPVRPLQNKTVG